MIERARTLSEEALARYQAGARAESIELWEQALAALTDVEQRERASILALQAVAYRDLGKLDRSRIVARKAMRLASDCNALDVEVRATMHLADIQILRQDYDDANRCLDRVVQLTRASGQRNTEPGVLRRRAEVALCRGDRDVLDSARAAQASARDHDSILEEARALAIEAVAVARLGRAVEAAIAVDCALGMARAQGSGLDTAEIRLLAARSCLDSSRAAEALGHAMPCAAYADEVGNARLRSQADALIAAARSRLGTGADARRNERFLDVTAAIARMQSPAAMFDAVADAALELLEADRAFVLRRMDDTLELAAARARDGADPGRPSGSILARTIDDAREVLATDIDERSELRDATSVVEFQIRSALSVPLVDGRAVVGALYVDSQHIRPSDFNDSVRMLRALAAHGARAVAAARQSAEKRARDERLEKLAEGIRGPATTLLTLANAVREGRNDPVWLDEVAAGLEHVGRGLLTLVEPLCAEEDGYRPVDLGSLTRSVVDELGWEARRRGVILEIDAEDGAWVRGDADAIARAVAGLLTTAMTNVPAGSRVSARVTVEFDEVIATILDPHASAEAPALARRIVSEHRGSLVTSAVDGQVEHRLTLPHIIGVTSA